MAWFLFYLSLITLIIPAISQSFTRLPEGTWNSNNANYWNYYANATFEMNQADGDYWFYPEYNKFRNNDGGSGGPGLGGMTSTLPDGTTPVWGWWGRWGQQICNDDCICDDDCLYTDDPDRSMTRYFSCPSHGTVSISMDLWMCLDTWDNANGQSVNIGGTTTIYYARTGDGGTNQVHQHGQFSNNDNYGKGAPDTNCDSGTNIRKKSISDGPFNTDGPGSFFSITLNWEASGEGWNKNFHVAAMNNLQITCTQEPTAAPTKAPTSTTDTPSKTPSQSPSKYPTQYPSKYPTETPTKHPTTQAPSQSPTTPIPSKHPTKTPTQTPTKYPTTDPTEVPTIKPTIRPTPSPTANPTADRSFGQQWGDAFGSGGDCADGWVSCNLVVFIILLVIVIFCLLYWILGGVWYKRRQDNRPLPAFMMNQSGGGGGDGNVEMGATGTGGTGPHATSSKWKSAWELEQETKANQGGGGGNDGW